MKLIFVSSYMAIFNYRAKERLFTKGGHAKMAHVVFQLVQFLFHRAKFGMCIFCLPDEGNLLFYKLYLCLFKKFGNFQKRFMKVK